MYCTGRIAVSYVLYECVVLSSLLCMCYIDYCIDYMYPLYWGVFTKWMHWLYGYKVCIRCTGCIVILHCLYWFRNTLYTLQWFALAVWICIEVFHCCAVLYCVVLRCIHLYAIVLNCIVSYRRYYTDASGRR